MGIEIERKFIVSSDGWKDGPDGFLQQQGYLAVTPTHTVRIRIAKGRARLNVKSAQTGLTRAEFEYDVPVADAEQLMRLCDPVIEKTRYLREFAGRTWEVDVFHGRNDGMVVAEVEIDDEGDAVELPPWVGTEVSGDMRFRVAYLVAHPYDEWKGEAPSSDL
ncbi:MAG: CYTH domain-containing protein [Planctomycetota bacterium]|jgi:CYTH domain-containing protein